jgi:ribosomal protein S4
MPKSRPRLKIIRRFGVQLPGLTRKSAEKKPYPPGQHGQSQTKRRKTSEFRRLLEEKQKVRFNYGVSEGQIRRYLALARKMPGRTGDNLLAVLERRLDNVVFRMGYAPTIPAARQLVSRRSIGRATWQSLATSWQSLLARRASACPSWRPWSVGRSSGCRATSHWTHRTSSAVA